MLVVHNETSTGVTSRLPEIRHAIDRRGHPALLLVDAVSSLGSIDLRHDEWGLDVTLAGSQKGLMLPPGLSFNAISAKALAASRLARLPRAILVSGSRCCAANASGFFPYTPATNLLFGLREALAHARRGRTAERVRASPAARRGGARGRPRLAARHRCASGQTSTARSSRPSMMPDWPRCRPVPQIVLDRFNMSLGAGLGRFKGRAFRIGHLGDFNDLMLMGTLCGVEMGLAIAGVPFRRGGVDAALTASRRAEADRRGRHSSGESAAGRFSRNAATPSRKSWLA